MDSDPTPAADNVLTFRLKRAPKPTPGASPVGYRPVARHKRFVYDVQACPGGFAVTFDGAILTRHDTLADAIDNARLIAGNFWAEGIPTLVRVVEDDRSIRPVVSFG